ncbi:hypothetical protein GF326_04310 [Candidatus Bathyarchaeota archaeon]|nr:hypothetical protein [Candidatus Bathyarchaeota archaeon]
MLAVSYLNQLSQEVQVDEVSTIKDVLEGLGVPVDDVGTNIFLNGEYSSIDRSIEEDIGLGVFPDDMNLLYKWHFRKHEK